MCGIAGYIDNSINYQVLEANQKMGDAIKNRGPDSYGFWQDERLGINLIHRRLAILDLSEAGHQPMYSASKRYIMVFNGEIYNFKQIIKNLEDFLGSIIWRGHSDTEVILMAIETYGFEKMLLMLEGMFAIALWDRESDQLYLARDRVGEKPLYYGYFGGVFGFGSELKALQQHPKFKGEISQNSVAQMMLHNCIPAPYSIFNGIYKLEPANFLVLSYSEFVNGIIPRSKAYWQITDTISNRYSNYSSLELINKLDGLLNKVVNDQMVADVKVGCFLSGGVDSSTIAAIMQNQSGTPIQTFSIGFDVPGYNEAEYAQAVAKHIGSQHHELYVTEKDALSAISKLSKVYDEPFSDSSQIPTYLLCNMVSKEVKVALTGDGGDELFFGYKRYNQSLSLYKKISLIPTPFKFLINSIIFPFDNFKKINKLRLLLQSENFADFYTKNIAHWLNTSDLVLGSSAKNSSLWCRNSDNINDSRLMMQYLDLNGYLPDDNLVKVDRASMFHSLETRVPLLNHKIIEFAFSLSHQYKEQNQVQKWILKEVLYKYVPKKLIERPKKGFSTPISVWLRGELKDWASSLLEPTRLKSDGFFNHTIVERKFSEHIKGIANNEYYLWDVLMFQQWLDNFKASFRV